MSILFGSGKSYIDMDTSRTKPISLFFLGNVGVTWFYFYGNNITITVKYIYLCIIMFA